jgi:hypothetical protein
MAPAFAPLKCILVIYTDILTHQPAKGLQVDAMILGFGLARSMHIQILQGLRFARVPD